MKLIIIEGAGKKETIEKYLGQGYKVFATKGHVRDLPANSLAVNVKNNFEPKYVIMDDKKNIVTDLVSKAKGAEQIFLATDPDREGEAISWHLAHILNLSPDDKIRIEFNEISKKAVENALKNPRKINNNLVDAQQARRVLDRLVGYKVSPVLCKKIQGKLSAGRVQSVALKLVVLREREIINFKPEEYWTLLATLEKSAASSKSFPFKALLNQYRGKKIKVKNKQEMDEVLARLKGAEYIVSNIKRAESKSHAPAPFITSTMQQEASNKLGMNLKKTSSVAQQLYEGVEIKNEGKIALITYIRTDSTRVSPDAQNTAREYLRNKFGDKYIPEKPNVYASKKSAQDAHEAIRPISLERTPESVKESLNKDLYRLYKLIYERFLASQMSEAVYNNLTVDIDANEYTFRATGKTLIFEGFTAIYNTEKDTDKDEEAENAGEKENAKIPDLTESELLKLLELTHEQKFTKPPSRYTEAGIVKAMEEKGIGRPATYTPTITTLASRLYTEKDGKFIKPTELGFKVNDMLEKYFTDIMNIGFTADMENRLDDIEDGGKVWQSVVNEYYGGLEDKIRNALNDDFSLKMPDEDTDIACSKCGSMMVIKHGRNGKFLACPNFPKCRHTMSYNEDGTVTEKPVPAESDVACQKCGAKMIIKTGRFGQFLACPNYPECKNIINIEENNGSQEYGACPSCGKPLKKRKNKRGTFFYGCSGYPDCTFLANFPLNKDKCPKCSAHMFVKEKKNVTDIVCSNNECGNIISVPKADDTTNEAG